MAITPDGTHAYVTHQFSNMVSVIDTGTNTVTATATQPGAASAYMSNAYNHARHMKDYVRSRMPGRAMS